MLLPLPLPLPLPPAGKGLMMVYSVIEGRYSDLVAETTAAKQVGSEWCVAGTAGHEVSDLLFLCRA